MPLIAIGSEQKKRLDKIAVFLAQKRGVKTVTYASAVHELISLFEQVELSGTLKVVPT